MTTENATTPAIVSEHPVTYKDIKFNLTRHETQGKGDKASPIPYWGINANQFSLPTTKDKDGKDVLPADDDNASHQVDILAGMVGWNTVRDWAYQKVNNNLKAAQLEQGKDVYPMADKATYAKDYIMADWGVNSKGGGAAIKALKETAGKQGEMLANIMLLFSRMQKEMATNPAQAATTLAEITALQAEVAKLATIK